MLQKSASIEPWKDTQKLSNQLSINVAPCILFVQHEYESEANQSLDLAENIRGRVNIEPLNEGINLQRKTKFMQKLVLEKKANNKPCEVCGGRAT